jgi:capsular polysaccharide biosynthesis protein
VDANTVPHIRAERLVVPTVPDLDLNHPSWAVDFVRDRLLAPDLGLVRGRRIYVTRGRSRHTRIVGDEDELLAALAPYDFTVVDPGALTVAEQIRTFAEAEMIVAPHGAALANLAFASPGATVVEMFPPDFVQGCYWKLSTCVPELRYRYLLGRGRSNKFRDTRGVASDIDLDVGSLVRMVEPLVS